MSTVFVDATEKSAVGVGLLTYNRPVSGKENMKRKNGIIFFRVRKKERYCPIDGRGEV